MNIVLFMASRYFWMFFILSQLLIGNLSAYAQINGNLYPLELTTEDLHDPLGIDTAIPRLSWISRSERRGAVQTSYRILVASSLEGLDGDHGDLWDSGRVISGKSLFVPYEGRALKSGEKVFWKVRVWDRNGHPSDWSKPASWSMGLLDSSDWLGQWIGLDRETGEDELDTTFTRLAARYLRKEVNLARPVKRAVAHVAGLGLFELYINGRKISNAVLSPALSEYPDRAYYMSFDVTQEFRKGKNAIGVILGNGRYVGVRGEVIELYYDASKISHYGFPKMITQVEIEYTDGSRETIVSDESWTITTDGPIVANNAFDGEEYDARKEMPGWNHVGYDDSEWRQAEIVQPGAEEIDAQMTPAIEVTETIYPRSITRISPDTFIVDMGQNMVGWSEIKVDGKRGDTIALRFAERLQSNGHLYLDPIRTARVRDVYVLRGGGEEWEPRFTYHGFRYVEVTGMKGKPELDQFVGKVVHDALEPVGSFTTSNELLNQIYKNARWSIRGNYRSIPTDCPQRDERQGWLGDRATGSRGESYLFDNANFYLKWLQDIEDSQLSSGSLPDVAPTYWRIYSDNVTWPAAYIIIADMLKDQFADDRGIRRHYDSMKKWMVYMQEQYMEGHIISRDTYGDWGVPPEAPGLIHSEDSARKTDPAVLSTSYYFHLLGLMQEFAQHLGERQDAEEFGALKQKVKKAFNREFLDPETRNYSNNSATANVLALHFGLVPQEYRSTIFENLVAVTSEDFDGHISVGLVGVQAIMRTFSRNGRADIAYRLATNTEYPSWGYMVGKGATTMWELWNSDTADPFMNSWNHVMLLGDLLIWFYEDLAGIRPDPDIPGFKRIIMKPVLPKELKFVRASYDSPYGTIKSEWERKGRDFLWNIGIPANTSAVIYLPAGISGEITESGQALETTEGINVIGTNQGRKVLEISSGNYTFRMSL